jgi:Ca2+-binding EF-hand superfamily protein|eukprot:SAG25_NODE_1328_length_3280_cov_2.438227_3_plen_86_part_00
MSDISEMDADGDGEIDQLEWLSKMLVRLKKCEQDDIDEILHQFNVLDVDGSGKLDFADIAKVCIFCSITGLPLSLRHAPDVHEYG